MLLNFETKNESEFLQNFSLCDTKKNDLSIKVSDIDSTIEILNGSKDLVSAFSQAKTIIALTKDESKIESLKTMINLLQENESKLRSVELNPFELEIKDYIKNKIIIEAQTGVDIEISYEIQAGVNMIEAQQLKPLFIKFYTSISQNKGSDIKSLIGLSCKEAKGTDGHDMPYGKALKLLSDFDWNDLGFPNVTSTLKLLQNNLEVKSEFYHEKFQDDVHFYMIKVTEKNIAAIEEYAMKEADCDTGDNYAGLVAVPPSLDYYNHDNAEIWFAYSSNIELQNPTSPNIEDYSHIEMYTCVLTSSNAPFTSHSGIAKAGLYNGHTHGRLSMKLHSFAAKAILEENHNKEYMITAPVDKMREIFSKALEEKFGDASHLYIGHEDQPYPEETIESLNKQCSSLKKYKGTSKSDKFNKAYLGKQLAEQKELISNKEMTMPVNIKWGYAGCYDNPVEFVLNDFQGKNLIQLNQNDMDGEYAWFFKHKFIMQNSYSNPFEGDPLTTVKLSELADYITHNPIEHEVKVETVGDDSDLF